MLIGVMTMAIFCLLSYSAKTGTVAWFVSETSTTGSLVNAKTEDLLDITSTVISCADDGIAHVEATVTNKHVRMIPIRLGDVENDIAPGESTSVQIAKRISGERKRVDIPLKGFDDYIDEVIEIPLGQKCLETMTGSGHGDLEEESEADVVEEEAVESNEVEAVVEETGGSEEKGVEAGAVQDGSADGAAETEKSERDKTAAEPDQAEDEPVQQEEAQQKNTEAREKEGDQAVERESAGDAPVANDVGTEDSSVQDGH